MFSNNFTRWHAVTFVVIWLAFTALTYFIVSRGLTNASEQPMRVAATTVGSITGPMTGAISRGFQSCCLQFSLGLMPYCLSALSVATLAQVVRLPNRGWLTLVRLLAWVAGWFVWFGGGIVSFGHALS